MLPTLTYEKEVYTFTLMRKGNKQVYKFKNYPTTNPSDETIIYGISSVGVYVIDESVLKPEERAKFDGPTIDSKLYYISAQPFEGEEIFVWLSKEEFGILQPILDDIEEKEYEKYEYEFTRTTLRDMAENPSNYGREQLARALVCCPLCRSGLAGSVYRPHCSECDWDYDDAYREHPLDHE